MVKYTDIKLCRYSAPFIVEDDIENLIAAFSIFFFILKLKSYDPYKGIVKSFSLE